MPQVEYGLVGRRVTARVGRQAHRHSEIELNFIERGELDYLHGGQLVRLPEGRLAVFWAAIPHQVIHTTPATCLHWITVPLALFLQWHLLPALHERVLRGEFLIDPTNAHAVQDAFSFATWQQDLFMQVPERRRPLLLEIEARLCRLADDLSKNNPPATVPHGEGGRRLDAGSTGDESAYNDPAAGGDRFGSSEKARRMAQWIAGHYSEDLSIADVAAQVGLHPNYAMSLFKECFQVSLGEYLTQYRVAHAQRLLLVTELPIPEVARLSGFGSLSRFYAAFRRLCGQPPRRYRESST